MENDSSSLPTLYFDGACPVCSREIALYRKQVGAQRIHWVDASSCAMADLGPELNRTQALAQLHWRDAQGRLVSGAAAFAALWQQLPRWSWLGRWFGSGVSLRLLDWSYRLFLAIRPLWRKTPLVKPTP